MVISFRQPAPQNWSRWTRTSICNSKKVQGWCNRMDHVYRRWKIYTQFYLTYKDTSRDWAKVCWICAKSSSFFHVQKWGDQKILQLYRNDIKSASKTEFFIKETFFNQLTSLLTEYTTSATRHSDADCLQRQKLFLHQSALFWYSVTDQTNQQMDQSRIEPTKQYNIL